LGKVSKSKALSVPALGGEQSLNRYLAEIKKFPVLTRIPKLPRSS
jgi:RNA polymerase sigma-32 factor